MGTTALAYGLGILVLCTLGASSARSAGVPDLSTEEVAHVIAHGPWPPPAARDPSNRVSGNAAAIAFGRRLFHEPRFSANGYVACVTCHQTDRAYTDAISRARGLAPVDRNTPSVLNAAFSPRLGWSGSSDSLWMASLRPMLDVREMASSAARVAHVVRIGDGLACEYRRAFGRAPPSLDDEAVMVDVAKALAAFQETLVTGRTVFDDFRDAVERAALAGPGQAVPAAGYPAAARRGLRLFVGRGGCAACHAGANFTDGSLHAAAEPISREGGRDGSAGVPSRSAIRYALHGPFNDAPRSQRARVKVAAPLATRPLDGASLIKVPGLRNVAVTPPYLHDGSRDTLREAVRHAGAAPLADREVDDVVAFLHTLTDAEGAQRALQRPGNSNCR